MLDEVQLLCNLKEKEKWKTFPKCVVKNIVKFYMSRNYFEVPFDDRVMHKRKENSKKRNLEL